MRSLVSFLILIGAYAWKRDLLSAKITELYASFLSYHDVLQASYIGENASHRTAHQVCM